MKFGILFMFFVMKWNQLHYSNVAVTSDNLIVVPGALYLWLDPTDGGKFYEINMIY